MLLQRDGRVVAGLMNTGSLAADGRPGKRRWVSRRGFAVVVDGA